MRTVRTLLAAASLAALAFTTAPAGASCHLCFLPVDCDAACEPVYAALALLESRGAHDLGHALCDMTVPCDH